MKTKKYDDTQWHGKAINLSKSRVMRFLSIIQISKDGKVPTFKKPLWDAANSKAIIGDWVIEAAMSTSLAPRLSIRSTSLNKNFAANGNEIKFLGKIYKGTKMKV